MSYRLHITVPGIPLSTNRLKGRSQWVWHRNSLEWYKVIWALVKKRLPKTPLAHADIAIIRHSPRQLDYDGCVASMKPIVDALVKCGVLSDDSWRVTGPWHVDQQYSHTKNQFLTVIVTETRDLDLTEKEPDR